MQTPAPLGFYLKRLSDWIGKDINQHVAEQDLTMSQSHILLRLSRAGNKCLRMKELESGFRCAQSTAAGNIARLAKKQMVRCETDPKDRRVKLVILTEKGEALLQENHRIIREAEARLLSGLPAEDQENLLRILKTLFDAIGEETRPQEPPAANGP